MKIQGVYKIISKSTGKTYVGSTSDFEKRRTKHIYRLSHGTSQNSKLAAHVDMYGVGDLEFEVMEHVEKKEDLIIREQFYMQQLAPEFSIRLIAKSNAGLKASDATRRKMSQSMKGRISPRKGVKLSAQTKQKMSLSRLGNKNRLGQSPSSKTIEKIPVSNTGKKRSAEYGRAMSELKTGKGKGWRAFDFIKENMGKMPQWKIAQAVGMTQSGVCKLIQAAKSRSLLSVLFLLPLMAGAQTKHPTDSLAKYKLFWEKARDRAIVTSGGEKARWQTIESVYWQEAAYWSHERADSAYKAKKKK